jgi:hypothetical protein
LNGCLVRDFANLAFGFDQAQRGFREKEVISNTRPVAGLKSLFAAERQNRNGAVT